MLLSEGIALYCESRKGDGFAQNTIKNDYHVLTRICDIIGDVELTTITVHHLDTVLRIEGDRGLAAGSLNMYQSCLSAFSRWCRERGYMDLLQNPVGTRRYRKDPPKRKDYVPASQFGALLDAAERTHKRDRALVAAGLYLMIRQSELITIRIKDVNLVAREIDVFIRKTKDYDVMPISPEFHKELTAWFAAYEAEAGPLDPDWYAFPAIKSTAFHVWGVNPTAQIRKSEDIVRRALKGIGWKEGWVGVHVLRRSSARALFEENLLAGYDGAMREVQTWLHHASVTMTERYLGLELDREKRNKKAKDRLMFPSVAEQNEDSNVIPFKEGTA
jgi:integrase